eukprot:tig00000615_g2535.t1
MNTCAFAVQLPLQPAQQVAAPAPASASPLARPSRREQTFRKFAGLRAADRTLHARPQTRSFAAASQPRFTVGGASSGQVEAMWKDVDQAPEDPILGVNIAFNADKDPRKLNLGVGAYRTEEGKPLVLSVVRKVEKEIANSDMNKEYIPIEGLPDFRERTIKLILGENSAAVKENRVAVCQGLSGTGSLRIATHFLARYNPGCKAYVSNPTWGNHKNIFPAAGVPVDSYRYFSPKTNGLDFEGMLEDLKNAPEKSVMILHGCAHNPTGTDPTPEQWAAIADVVKARRHVALFDIAYQGFASGSLDRDAAAVRLFVERGLPVLITQSYAKNMGLYGERVGACSVVCESENEAKRVLSQLKTIVRPMYSSPPVHGARIASAILGDKALFGEWEVELKGMADRIIAMREALRGELVANGAPGTWDHIVDQIGMFSFTGLNTAQVERMINTHHVHMTKDGRISMAGVNTKNVAYLAAAMKDCVENA